MSRGTYTPLVKDMTLREHYAGLAMQGFIANGASGGTAAIAEWSVKFADALIAELERAK